jgi:hypothetical protein
MEMGIMDKKAAGLIGAISAFPLAASAPAAAKTIDEVMSPRSYAELLQPIPNAVALLQEMAAKPAPPKPLIQTAQYYYDPYNGGYGYGYGYYPRPRYHHHHHHHGYGGWGYNGGWGGYGPPRYHHHHHHHHNSYWNPW